MLGTAQLRHMNSRSFDYYRDAMDSPLEASLPRSPPRSFASPGAGAGPGSPERPSSVLTASFYSSASARGSSIARRKEVEEARAAERRMMWNHSVHIVPRLRPWSSASTGLQVAWETQGEECLHDRLNWNLEPHPQWIHKAPGTFGSHFERNMFYSPPLPSKACAWDSRSHLANCLSGDPVTDGLRRGLNNRRGTTTSNLSPTRPFLER